ncbi:MAG TPA: PfkB family carbohydrate kinase, partial [Bacteroidota bacterium]|nr:PfkB family carbohydrate kinase [Bacteroidota bacterium]
MSLLVVGTLAFDSIETPFGKVDNALGGSGTFIATAASYFVTPVKMVGVVGGDFPKDAIEFLESRMIDLEGLQVEKAGKTFRWGGKYHFDLNMRDTLFTELNVLEQFDARIPESYRNSQYICLGNIEPELQRKALSQITKPKLVVCDTMNFWIERRHEELMKTLKLIDVLIINDSEARQLSDQANLIRAAKVIMKMGPKYVIIKKGEHGAMLISKDMIFSAPAYPLENINDPTGAGDSFAGGFIGWIARTG